MRSTCITKKKTETKMEASMGQRKEEIDEFTTRKEGGQDERMKECRKRWRQGEGEGGQGQQDRHRKKGG